jgi:NADH-quinone oxidoreductase subunit H
MINPIMFIGFYQLAELYQSMLSSIGLNTSVSWLYYGLAAASISFIVINTMVLSTAFYVWFERRTIARFQVRRGPNRHGPFGLFQSFADVIKAIMKENTMPTEADGPVFTVAPIVLIAPTLLIMSVIPFGEKSFLGSLNIGILFIVGVTSINSIAIFMAGWGSRNKYAILGAMRGAAMLISYEIPMAIGITSVLLISGSLAMTEIEKSQDIWFIVVMPLGFFVFIVAAIAEMSRTPFDQIEAESELGSGYNTEYSGIKFAVLFLAEFMAPLITSSIVTTLFLGGTQGFDFLPGQIWFILKTFTVVFILLWLRATWPRLRIDQIMSFAWKILFGLGIFNIFLIAVEYMILTEISGEPKLDGTDMLIMGAINWIITIIILFGLMNLFGNKKLNRATPIPSPLANMNPEVD